MAVGEHEVLRAGLGFESDGDVGDAGIDACEAAEEVDAEGAGGPLHLQSDGVRPGSALGPDLLHLIQQVLHRHDLVLWAPDGPRPHTRDPLQMLPDAHHHNTQLYTSELNSAALFLLYCYLFMHFYLSIDREFCFYGVLSLIKLQQRSQIKIQCTCV